MSSFEGALLRLREGSIGFEEFAVLAREPVARLARMIARRWALPTHVELRDVEQDLMLAVTTRFVWDWEPGRGVSIERYVVFNAVDKAKKHLHKQRNALRRDDRSPGRLERPLSSLTRKGEEDEAGVLERVFVKGGVLTDADQLDLLERSEAVDRVFAVCRSEREREVMRLVAEEGDLERAAERAFERDREKTRVRSRAHALRLVYATACAVAGRLADEGSSAA